MRLPALLSCQLLRNSVSLATLSSLADTHASHDWFTYSSKNLTAYAVILQRLTFSTETCLVVVCGRFSHTNPTFASEVQKLMQVGRNEITSVTESDMVTRSHALTVNMQF
jgi:hypothetical protein